MTLWSEWLRWLRGRRVPGGDEWEKLIEASESWAGAIATGSFLQLSGPAHVVCDPVYALR
jgi:hypothetical protein